MADRPPIKTRIESVLNDPSAAAIARVYAKAFLLAVPPAQTDALLQELRSFLDDVLRKNPDFTRLLTSPLVNRHDKLRIIDRAVSGRASDHVANFLRVLARHDRLDLLPLIVKQSLLEVETRSGQRRVQVTSAQPLSPAALEKIKQRLAGEFSFEPVLEPRADPALLGGLRIRIGDTLYDGSLRARLKQLRHRVRERSLHEIQSGRDRFSHPERD